MSSGSLARRYAKALVLIGEEEGSLERIGSEVAGFSAAMRTSEELATTLSNPLFPRAEREALAKAILQKLGASQTVVNFARLLLDRERMMAVPDIARELSVMIDDRLGRMRAEVTSAKALGDGQKQQLKSTLERLSGKSIDLHDRVDPALLGGVVAKVGDLEYDGSLRTHLRKLQDSMLN